MVTAEVEAKPKAKKEPPVIDVIFENCKGCNICVDVCPTNVLVLVKVPNKWEGYIAEVKFPEKCTRCMLCEIECPDFAIKVY